MPGGSRGAAITVFKEYAEYYDLLYYDKDYASEVRYVTDLIERYHPQTDSILDLGCGTGNHDLIFAKRGYRVAGVDRSAEATAKARAKCRGQASLNLCFATGQIESLRMAERFDAVVSLFHVMSYLTTDRDLQSAFETARLHLNPDGIFIFDCWYGPAVLSDPPAVRVKQVGNDVVDVIRIAEPEVRPNENIVNVNYQVLVFHKATGQTMTVIESHPMRYWFKSEIDRILEAAGFKTVDCMEWMTGRKVGQDTWNACFIAKNSAKGGE
jgi:SAM-dependent methyltransferase